MARELGVCLQHRPPILRLQVAHQPEQQPALWAGEDAVEENQPICESATNMTMRVFINLLDSVRSGRPKW